MKIAPSPFIALANIEYFQFEEDFVEENVRCIPMIVRFKMDEACIKLKLSEWSKFMVEERIELAVKPCTTKEEVVAYKEYLVDVIKKYTSNQPSAMSYNPSPDWANTTVLPKLLEEKLLELKLDMTIGQWQALTHLKRFALLKLCKSGHENKNLPKALREFGFGIKCLITSQMIRKIHTIKINLHGGIVAAGNLYTIMCAAENARVKEVQFGTRQQLYIKVADRFANDFLTVLADAGIGYEANEELHPNIVSSYVTEEVFQNANWLSEGVYKDILDLFDYQPKLKINLVDNGQTFVPFFTGNMNFIASSVSNYWYLHIRFAKTNTMYKWPALIYSADIPGLAKIIEATLVENHHLFGNNPATNAAQLPVLVFAKANFITHPIEQDLKLPEFTLPYYEGFNSYGNKTWLGIHRRNEQFDVAFLKDVCAICLKTKVGQLYTTPWKSLVIKGIQQTDRKLWNYVLGKFRINVRHASNELNWQVEDLCDEGLALKRYLVRAFDKDDVRTYGLCFAIKTIPKSGIFGSVIIRKQENKAPNKYKTLDRYDILYTKDFNPNSKELVLFRKDIEKENLEVYLVSLCKYFYEWQNDDVVNHSIYQSQLEPGKPAVIAESMVHQCTCCYTIYDEAYGDTLNNVAPGTPFHQLKNYECPTCGEGAAAFKEIPKPVFIT